jgi:hypothetical protein
MMIAAGDAHTGHSDVDADLDADGVLRFSQGSP